VSPADRPRFLNRSSSERLSSGWQRQHIAQPSRHENEYPASSELSYSMWLANSRELMKISQMSFLSKMNMLPRNVVVVRKRNQANIIGAFTNQG